jgi:CDP-glucose 4,6-dehydratase
MFRDIYRGKRVLVTGHTGFKGAWLSEWLLKLGADVIGFSIDVPTEPSVFEALDLGKRVKDIRGDILNPISLTETFLSANPEIVFHLAAQPLVRFSYDEPKLTFETNAIGTLNVLEAIRKTKSVKAGVIVTTDKVYENLEQDYRYQENDKLGGFDPYSASKACAEIIFSSYVRSFFQDGRKIGLASARAGNVIGGGDWSEDRIVADAARSWSKKEAVRLRNPNSTRPWQHVLEPVGGYLLLAEKLLTKPEKFHGEAYNFGPSEEANRTVIELIEELKKNWPAAQHFVDPNSSAKASGKHEAGLLNLSIEKAKKDLNWQPKLDFPTTAKWTVDWYRKDKGGVAALTAEQITAYEKALGV